MKKETQNTYLNRVPAADQAIRVLECLAQNAPTSLKLVEICNQLGINQSKGYSLLSTLCYHGLVHKDGRSKTYNLGLGLVALARNVLDHLQYRDVAQPFLNDLCQKTGATALLGLLNGSQVVVVANSEADLDIGVTMQVGKQYHMTFGAHGKAILAFLDDTERESILQGDEKYFFGKKTWADGNMTILEKEIALCRQTGYAVDTGQAHPGINAVSAPVFRWDRDLIGCLILVGTFPVELAEEYGQITADTASALSGRLSGVAGTGARPQGIWNERRG